MVERSSGNVFWDLDFKNAEERKTKVRLAVAINQILEKGHVSQAAAAEQLGVNQPKISALSNYRLDGFSVERLMNFLNALGRDVEIVIRRPHSRRPHEFTSRLHETNRGFTRMKAKPLTTEGTNAHKEISPRRRGGT